MSEIKFQPKPTHPSFKDIDGKQYGQLTVIGLAHKDKNSSYYWYCECSCGNIKIIRGSHITAGLTKSCGCLVGEFHGETKKTPEYNGYAHAKKRCRNPNDHAYHDYGGRGIEFRFTSFEEFLAEVGRKPSPTHSLNRIDNDGHYEKGNVEWATKKEQGNNRRSNIILIYNGSSKTLSEWADELGLSRSVLYARKHLGWCDGCLLKQPPARCAHQKK